MGDWFGAGWQGVLSADVDAALASIESVYAEPDLLKIVCAL
jgi:hypothetical protein